MDEENKKEEVQGETVKEETKTENLSADQAEKENPQTETESKTETETQAKTATDGPIDPKQDAHENKWWGVLSYLGVLVILPLLIKKDSDFAQFHAKQGTVLLIGWILSWLPFGPILAFISFVLSVIGIINALHEEKKDLPVVGELAEKIKF